MARPGAVDALRSASRAVQRQGPTPWGRGLPTKAGPPHPRAAPRPHAGQPRYPSNGMAFRLDDPSRPVVRPDSSHIQCSILHNSLRRLPRRRHSTSLHQRPAARLCPSGHLWTDSVLQTEQLTPLYEDNSAIEAIQSSGDVNGPRTLTQEALRSPSHSVWRNMTGQDPGIFAAGRLPDQGALSAAAPRLRLGTVR